MKFVPREKSEFLPRSVVLLDKQRIFPSKKRECLCADCLGKPLWILRAVSDHALGGRRSFDPRPSGVSRYAGRSIKFVPNENSQSLTHSSVLLDKQRIF